MTETSALALLARPSAGRHGEAGCSRCGALVHFVGSTMTEGDPGHYYMSAEVLCPACGLRDVFTVWDWWHRARWAGTVGLLSRGGEAQQLRRVVPLGALHLAGAGGGDAGDGRQWDAGLTAARNAAGAGFGEEGTPMGKSKSKPGQTTMDTVLNKNKNKKKAKAKKAKRAAPPSLTPGQPSSLGGKSW